MYGPYVDYTDDIASGEPARPYDPATDTYQPTWQLPAGCAASILPYSWLGSSCRFRSMPRHHRRTLWTDRPVLLPVKPSDCAGVRGLKQRLCQGPSLLWRQQQCVVTLGHRDEQLLPPATGA
jgi:hypothetical protein